MYRNLVFLYRGGKSLRVVRVWLESGMIVTNVISPGSRTFSVFPSMSASREVVVLAYGPDRIVPDK